MKLANGKEHRLLYNNYALSQIGKAFGGINNIDAALAEDNGQLIDNVITIIRIGINAGIEVDNLLNLTEEPVYTQKEIALLLPGMSTCLSEFRESFSKSFEQEFENENTEEKKTEPPSP